MQEGYITQRKCSDSNDSEETSTEDNEAIIAITVERIENLVRVLLRK